MRLAALVRESTRDILSGTARFSVYCGVLTLVVGGLVTGDAAVIRQQVSAAETFRDSGGSTQILTATGRIDGSACERLASISGVMAAGAIRQSSKKVTINTIPDAPVPAYQVSPGFPGVLAAPPEHSTGVILSTDVATTLGAKVGDVVQTDAGPMPIGSTYQYPSDGRRPGFGYALLSVTNDQAAFDECWVNAWPEVTNLRALLFTALLAGEPAKDDRPELSQLNPSLGTSFHGHEAFMTRVTRSAAPLALALSILIGYIAVRTRRLQIASALHAGVPRGDVIAIHLMEAGAWSGTATAIAFGITTLTSRWVPPGDAVALVQTLIDIPLAGLAGAMLGALLATCATREKHLFTYFKDR